MVSLQEKGRFCLHSLEVVAAHQAHPPDEPKPATGNSQMEAVRQLLLDAHTGAPPLTRPMAPPLRYLPHFGSQIKQVSMCLHVPGAKGDARQQLMASIAQAALQQEVSDQIGHQPQHSGQLKYKINWIY